MLMKIINNSSEGYSTWAQRHLILGRNPSAEDLQLLPTAYVVWGRLCFHRRESFCPRGEGGLTIHTPPDQGGRSSPPPNTPGYGQSAVGTHPTGMHPCLMGKL